ncbi:hypothetical protein M426DRAFT_320457 [Hypoxylon sp. CI-4A]|nr:hypothetical protein M426DRAFT_320457 [Hypoxylon sp. CI-4A]
MDGVGDPFIFGNDMQGNGQLDALETLPGADFSPDLLFNQSPNIPAQLPPESEAGPSDRSMSSPEMQAGSSTASQGQTPKSHRRSPPADPVTALKRQRNNVAARKYRQKRIDRISELEEELRGIKEERDDLRLRLARQEAETAALRSMLQLNSGKGAKG